MGDFPVLVRIMLPEGREMWLSAERVAPGLVVSPAVKLDGFCGGWALTHEPSGFAFGSIGACLTCIHAALPVLADIDWTRNRDDLQGDKDALLAGLRFVESISECDGDCTGRRRAAA